MMGQRTVSRGIFSAWNLKQWRSHHRVHTFMPIHQLKRSSMLNERVVQGDKRSSSDKLS